MESESITDKTDAQSQHWARIKESGSLLGMRIMLNLYRLFGRGVFIIILNPIMLFYIWRQKLARRASYEFLTHHYQTFPEIWSKQPNFLSVLRHFVAFGESMLDKLLAWSSHIKEEDFTLLDEALVKELLADERGQLIIGSHFGNLEFCRGFMQRYKDKIINILVYDKHSAKFVNMMQSISSRSRINVYQVDELDIALILKLKQKIAEGEWLFIAGDRIPVSGEQNTVDVEFLGESAKFPIGPYALANALACPVKVMISYKKKGRIIFSVKKFNQDQPIKLVRKQREEQFQNLAEEFAQILQEHCREAPYQWFNFYDFWGTQYD